MKAAVYAGTRNLYKDMVTAAKSLLKNSDVEKVYFLIEDDAFPEWLPPQIETINVSEQPYFRRDGANYNCQWSYMVLMKLALYRLFPDLERILVLDVDTIVVGDISDLWDIDLASYYVAGAKEPLKSTNDRLYINAGVMMLNLKRLRDSWKGDEMLNALNRKKYFFCEQDCIAERCQGGILEIDGDYNACCVTEHSDNPKIIHYAAVRNWQKNRRAWRHGDLVKIRKMKWGDILHENNDSSTNI